MDQSSRVSRVTVPGKLLLRSQNELACLETRREAPKRRTPVKERSTASCAARPDSLSTGGPGHSVTRSRLNYHAKEVEYGLAGPSRPNMSQQQRAFAAGGKHSKERLDLAERPGQAQGHKAQTQRKGESQAEAPTNSCAGLLWDILACGVRTHEDDRRDRRAWGT